MEHFIEGHRYSPNVALVGILFPLQELGGFVADGADDCVLQLDLFRNAEIGQLDDILGSEEDGRRLNVTRSPDMYR